jgi:hypothetical protein
MQSKNINTLIYEDIDYKHPTYTFGKAKYGEFEVLMIKENGFINATKLCTLAGKNFTDYARRDWFKELVKFYNLLLSERSSKIILQTEVIKHLRGTYIHPKILPHLLSRLSVEFADKVSDIVNNWVVREYKESIREKDTKIDDLMRELKIFREESKKDMDKVIDQNTQVINQNNQLLDQNEIIADELLETKDILMDTQDEVVRVNDEIVHVSGEMVKVNIKLGIACNERVPRPDSKSIEHFVFLKLSSPITKINGITYIYQVVRAKEVSLQSMINRNPGDVLLDLQCVPNSMLLFNFIRTESRKNPKAGYKCCGNSINLFIEEDEFIKFIHESYNYRLTIKN